MAIAATLLFSIRASCKRQLTSARNRYSDARESQVGFTLTAWFSRVSPWRYAKPCSALRSSYVPSVTSTRAPSIDPWLSLGVLSAGGLLAFAMSVFLFKWDSKNVTRGRHPVLALLAWAPYLVGLLLSL